MGDQNKFDKFRDVHLLEKHRVDSFKDWPYDNDSTCSIAKMAQAGFYWSGNERENDTVSCFVCGKTLDGWESTDDPWKEHAKHAPQCLFVKFGRKQMDLNVEEFLQIFKEVVKQRLVKQHDQFRKQMIKWANQEKAAYLKK